MTLLVQQGGSDPVGPPRHDRLWHRGTLPHKGPEEGPYPGLATVVCTQYRGGGGIWGGDGPLQGPPTEGAGPGILY